MSEFNRARILRTENIKYAKQMKTYPKSAAGVGADRKQPLFSKPLLSPLAKVKRYDWKSGILIDRFTSFQRWTGSSRDMVSYAIPSSQAFRRHPLCHPILKPEAFAGIPFLELLSVALSKTSR